MTFTFINREDALCLVGKKIRGLRHGSESEKEHIFVLHGVPGIGKTELLSCLKMHYSRTEHDCIPVSAPRAARHDTTPCMEGHDPVPCVYLDSLDYTHAHAERGFVEILKDILAASSPYLPTDRPTKLPDLLSDISQYEKDHKRLGQDTARIAHLTDGFVSIVENLVVRNHVVLVLLDNADELDRKIFEQFETQVLNHFRATPGFIVIMTSNRPIDWSKSFMSQYAKVHQLTVFPVECTRQQISVNASGAADRIHKLTGGHPYANDKATQWLRNRGVLDNELDEWIRYNGDELSEMLKEEVIDAYMLQGSGIDVCDAFLKASVARLFEINLFFDLLTSKFYPRQMRQLDTNWYLRLLGEMQRTQLLSWDRERRAYVMEPSVRRMLAAYLRLNHKEDFDGLTKEVVLRKYDEWIGGGQEDMHMFVAERLYHAACLLACGDPILTPKDVSKKLMTELDELIPPETDKKKLKDYLRKEHDSDFGEIMDLNELIMLI